jgi:hypothetical protein
LTPSFFERASAAEVEAEATLSVEETLPAEGPVTAQKRRLRKRTCISARARVALSPHLAPPHLTDPAPQSYCVVHGGTHRPDGSRKEVLRCDYQRRIL